VPSRSKYVYLSCVKSDLGRAVQISKALKSEGIEVRGRDHQDFLVPGATHAKPTPPNIHKVVDAVRGAKLVLVIWSKESISAPWVLDEASAALADGKLLGVTFDGTNGTFGFGKADISIRPKSFWKWSKTTASLERLVKLIRAKTRQTDIFVSYSRADKVFVTKLADALSTLGLNVWWDPSIIPGEKFKEVISYELGEAKCILVVWSTNSARSEWVRYEASSGRDRGILCPISIDGTQPPEGFDGIHAEPFSTWNGHDSDPIFRKLADAVFL